ncbi:type VII secretion system-associated protein [Streptomyces bluensis]|uniref:type VII secretion system-associated protein n=1 Tax=Streptomyces bluensis TaxID=33897 RepID=UPI00167A8A17|nr:type VII secretion system-associated protein [Streptomyces bluensis]
MSTSSPGSTGDEPEDTTGAEREQPEGRADGAGTAGTAGTAGAEGRDVQGGPNAVLRGEPGFREPPEDYIAAARVAPNHWLSIIDRHWHGAEGEPPPSWASLGRWRSDENGEIVEWEENSEYRPSPDAYGWARPVSPADAAVQLVATGYGSEELFALVLADAEVAVCVEDGGELAVTDAPDGTRAVPVFSHSPELEDDKLPAHEIMTMPDLLDRLPDGREVLFLSSSAPVAQLVAPSALRAGIADLERYEAEAAEEWPEPDPSAEWPAPQPPAGGLPPLTRDLPDISSIEEPPGPIAAAERPVTETAGDAPRKRTGRETTSGKPSQQEGSGSASESGPGADDEGA